MKNTVSRVFAAFLCVIMTFAFTAISVHARERVDTEKKASLTLDYVSSGAKFSVYKVGEISTYGELSLSGDFAKYPVSLDNDQDGWREVAATLKGYVAKDNIQALKSGESGADKKLTFGDMQVGLYLVIGEKTVEKSGNTKTVYTPSEFMVCLPNIVDENSDWVYDVSATPKYEKTKEELVDIDVIKVWEDEGNEKSRPTSIEVELLRGSEVYDTQTLSESNNWKYTWNDLSAESEWSVVEKNVPSDYTVKMSQTGGKYIITNTSTTTKPTATTAITATTTANPNVTTTAAETTPPKPDNPDLPQTGMLWWPVGLLAAGGLALILVGVVRKMKDNDK